MAFVRKGRNPGQQAKASDTRVQAIARALAEHPIAPLVDLLQSALYGPATQPTTLAIKLLVAVKNVPPEAQAAAERLATGAFSISTISSDPVKKSIRGVVIETSAEALIAVRGVRPEPEVAVDGLPDPPHDGGTCPPWDLVVEDPPGEVFECKSASREIEQSDLDRVAACDAALEPSHPEVRFAFVTLQPTAWLGNHLSRLASSVPIYGTGFETFHQLAADFPGLLRPPD